MMLRLALALAVSAGCWRPEPVALPELAPLPAPAPEELAADDSGTEAAADRVDGAPADGDDASAVVVSDMSGFTPWNAVTVGAPCTLVDGYGKPVAVLNRLSTPLRVVSEDSLRFGVECDVCVPKSSGYVQRSLIEKVP